MTDYTELKRLADELIAANDLFNDSPQDNEVGDAWSLANDHFTEAASPEVIKALITENERLNAECKQLILLECNGGTAQAAINLLAERDELRAEIAGLKTGYEAYDRVNAELKAECEALRREREGKVLCDLELFETLRDSANSEADEHRQCMATYRPLRQANLDSVVKKCDDLLAAIGQGERS